MMSSSLMKVAAIQMVSGIHVEENLKTARILIQQAKQTGAQLIVLPEYFACLPKTPADRLLATESLDNGQIQTFLSEVAKSEQVYLVGGSLALQDGTEKPYDTTLIYDPTGVRIARYDKIHLFKYQTDEEYYDEHQDFLAGSHLCSFLTPWGRVGVAICYDIRFPELFRQLSLDQTQPLDLICIVAAFTHTTGHAHWEVLLRARAIENQCYVLASAQGGIHANGRHTWGQSCLIDPWGSVLTECTQGVGVVTGEVSSKQLASIRQQLPALSHRCLG